KRPVAPDTAARVAMKASGVRLGTAQHPRGRTARASGSDLHREGIRGPRAPRAAGNSESGATKMRAISTALNQRAIPRNNSAANLRCRVGLDTQDGRARRQGRKIATQTIAPARVTGRPEHIRIGTQVEPI